MPIPKRIFYVWSYNQPKKSGAVFCLNSWKHIFKDYQIIEINERSTDFFNFEKELKTNKWFNTVYSRKMYAYVSDYIRLKVLSDFGGIYLDTDVTAVKTFDDLLNNKCFVGLQSDTNFKDGDAVEPAILGAEKNNPFLKKVLSFYDKKIWESHLYRIPSIFSYYLNIDYPNFKNQPRDKQTIVNLGNITIYPERYFIPFRFRENFSLSSIKNDTHTIHWFGNSWHDQKILFFLENKHRYPLEKIDVEYEKQQKKDSKKPNLFHLLLRKTANKIFNLSKKIKEKLE